MSAQIAHLPGIALAALVATLANFVIGGILFGVLSGLQGEFKKYPALFRPHDQMMKMMPLAVISMYGAVFAAAFIYALGFPQGARLLIGMHLAGALGVFAVCGFVLHNHVNLNIGTRLTVYQAIAYFVQWFVVGIVVSLMYHG